MAATTDFTRLFQDMMPAFNMDPTVFRNAFEKQAAFGEKLTKIAFEAAERSCDLQAKLSRETLSRLSDVTKARAEPADYTKAASDFATASREMASDSMAAFAEIAKKAQMETVELLLSTGKTAQENAAAAMQKATGDMAATMQRPAAAAAK